MLKITTRCCKEHAAAALAPKLKPVQACSRLVCSLLPSFSSGLLRSSFSWSGADFCRQPDYMCKSPEFLVLTDSISDLVLPARVNATVQGSALQAKRLPTPHNSRRRLKALALAFPRGESSLTCVFERCASQLAKCRKRRRMIHKLHPPAPSRSPVLAVHWQVLPAIYRLFLIIPGPCSVSDLA